MQFVGDNAQEKFWLEAAAAAKADFARPRRYLVGLSVLVTAELEVDAGSPEEAQRLAERMPEGARRTMFTKAYATRVGIQRRERPGDPTSELVWVELEERPVDPFNPDSPKIWAEKK